MDSDSRSRSSRRPASFQRGPVATAARGGGSAESGARSPTLRSAAAIHLADSQAPSGRGGGLLGPVPAGAWLLGGLGAGPCREVMSPCRKEPQRRFSTSSRNAELSIIAIGDAGVTAKLLVVD